MTIAEKKKKVLAYLKKKLDPIDPGGVNYNKYEKLFTDMNEKQFDQFMINMRDGKWEFHITVPNMGPKFSLHQILEAADGVGLKIFHRIWLTDPSTGKKYLSRSEYPVLKLPIRRMQQFLDKKLSVPDNDKSIDGLTGQVSGDDKAASITGPEIQALHSRGLKQVLNELVTVRGGDIANYGEARRQMEEQGSVSLGSLDSTSISRTAKITEIFLQCMHIESNLTSGE